MKHVVLSIFVIAFLFTVPAGAQSFYFGLKGGPTIGTQQWGRSFQRDPLFRYHVIGFLESLEEDDKYALFAQLGYHVKGSAIRTYATTGRLPDGSIIDIPARETPFEFKNLSLSVGAKQKFSIGIDTKVFYLLGIRGDYTLDTNLRPTDLETYNIYSTIYPFEEYVNKFMFGAIAGAGLQWSFSEFVGGVLEFTVNPDFTRQYNQPEIPNVINPNPGFGSNTITIPERQISNVTFEVTLGLRFLRKVIYVD